MSLQAMQYVGPIIFIVGYISSIISYGSDQWFSLYLSEKVGTSNGEDEYNITDVKQGLVSFCLNNFCLPYEWPLFPLGDFRYSIVFSRNLMIISLSIESVCAVVEVFIAAVRKKYKVSHTVVLLTGSFELIGGCISFGGAMLYDYFGPVGRRYGNFGSYQYGFYLAWVSGVAYVIGGTISITHAILTFPRVAPIKDDDEKTATSNISSSSISAVDE